MQIKAGMETEWQQCQDNNQDPYGHAVVQYAQTWGELMESKLAEGNTVEAIAKETARTADAEGITGFMYGCAVSILSRVWEHGEALRRWHNLDAQLGTEGEKANESGGVLNPALMTISS